MLCSFGEYVDSLLFPMLPNCTDISNPIFNKASKGPWHHLWLHSKETAPRRKNNPGRNSVLVQGVSLQSHLPLLHRTTFKVDYQKLQQNKTHRHLNKGPLTAVTGTIELALSSRWLFIAKSLLWHFGGSEWLRTNTISLWLHLLTEKQNPSWTYSEDFLVSLKRQRNPPEGREQHAWLSVSQNQWLLALEA